MHFNKFIKQKAFTNALNTTHTHSNGSYDRTWHQQYKGNKGEEESQAEQEIAPKREEKAFGMLWEERLTVIWDLSSLAGLTGLKFQKINQTTSFNFIRTFVCLVYTCVCVLMHVCVCVFTGTGQFLGIRYLLSLCEIQVVSIGSKHLYLLSHLVGPRPCSEGFQWRQGNIHSNTYA